MSRKYKQSGHLGVIDSAGHQPVKPPGLLRVIQKTSSGHYEQLLAHLFSAADDLFYDLSKRASSNQEQNLYFEAMREIRIRREGIANHFLRSLSLSYAALLKAPCPDDWGDDGDIDAALSIVKSDDLEVDLAVSNMVSRTKNSYHSELHELNLRLDHLLLQVEVSEENNPLAPLVIARAFVGACQEGLEASIKIRLILFKLFEKHVLKQLGHIYADVNQILLDAGILPKIPSSLRPELRRSTDRPASKKGGGADTKGGHRSDLHAKIDGADAAEFSMQQGALGLLMEAARNLAQNSASHVISSIADAEKGSSTARDSGVYQTPRYYIGTATQPHSQQPINCYIYSSNPGAVMGSPELTQELTQAQLKMEQRLLGSKVPQNIVPNIVQELLSKSNPEKPNALKQADENVINLVSMFFDQILADDSLHAVVQSLICRIQIPVLKVALKDSSFFSDSTHPARKLINSITELGVGFDESKPVEKDSVYRKISEMVKALNASYRAEDDIFSALQADLDAFIAKEGRKAKIVEQRTTQTEEGKAKIKQARMVTQDLIYQAIKGVELPDAVKHFLITHWLQVMVVTNLKTGVGGKEWAANEQIMMDLVWVSTAHSDSRSIQRRERMLPELLDRLEVELEAVISNPVARKESVELLEQSLREDSLGALESEDVGEEGGEYLTSDEKASLGRGGGAPKVWAEMTAVEKQKVRYEELATQYFEMAKNVDVGSWLEYSCESGGKPIRCKLASKIDADTYLFINRFGFKVLEKTRKQFAYDMQFDRARILDSRPLFDRVMGKVVGSLSS